MKNSTIEHQIIAKALAASTFEEALEVEKLIAESGAPYERPVGDRYNNFGLLAPSGSSFEYKALEPLTNAQDAILERRAAARWGDVKKVPYQRPTEAAQDLLGGLSYQQQGELVTVKLCESDAPTRSSKRLTLVYRDHGCGMEPSAIPKTIFALGSSHKTSTNWQQGAFGVGGASTYRNARAAILVTRRAPEMNPKEDRIAVAVVLWEAQGKGQSAYYQVTTDWQSDVNAEPWSASATEFPDFDYGTHFALISYGVERFHRAYGGDEGSFYTVTNTRLYDPVMPVKFIDDINRGKTEYLRGLGKRLADNPAADRLMDEELVLYTHDGDSYRLPIRYFIFPKGKDADGKEVKGSRRKFVGWGHALVFTSNGQVHHHWTPDQFKLKTKLGKLKDRVLVVVDTDNLPIKIRTALFTPDRSQLLASDAAIQLEDQVADFLNNWVALVEANNDLIRQAISSSSGGKSVIQVGRRIADALKVRGFSLSGSGKSGGGGGGGGNGGPRRRKKVETYVDPTALEGPDRITVEDGKVRYLQYMLNAKDDFLDSGRGELIFTTNHPDIRPEKDIVPNRLRDGYVQVQLSVPEGALEGEFKIDVRLEWQKAAGGIGSSMRYSTVMEVVDEIGKRGSGGGKSGTKGGAEGAQVAVVWTTPEESEELNNGIPGYVDDVPAIDLAEKNADYSELAEMGDKPIPTIFLNSTYAPYKNYVSGRAKTLTEEGTQGAGDRYAVGAGLGLLLLHERLKSSANSGEASLTEEQIVVAKQAVAQGVLAVLPDFDAMARATGLEEG